MIGSALNIPAPAAPEEDNPLWLIVLCDLMTNLMLFFLILYSFSLKSEADRADAMLEMERSVRGEVIVHKKKEELLSQLKDQEAAAAILREFERAGLKNLTKVDVSESQIRIRMEAPVLFASGGADLTPAARRRLAPVGRMLRGLPGPVVIEGHTDDIPVRSGPYPSNWELSVARSSAVLRHMAATFAIPASRLVAAGYGEFRPVADNATARGRAQNRRIEIVVMRKTSLAVMGRGGAPDQSRANVFRRSVGGK